MGIRCGYLIWLAVLPMLASGKAVQQTQQRQRLEKWQLEQLEVQLAHNADKDHGPWIHISSAVLHLVPDEQTQLLVLQVHEGSSGSSTISTNLPQQHNHEHQPRHGISDNLDFQQQPTLKYMKSHGR